MSIEASNTSSLKQLRQQKQPKENRLKKWCPWLFNWQSPFYFGVFLMLLAFGWMGYAIFNNSGTQLLNWDYTWQYIPFTYDYWDSWHIFFTTGKFPLYDAGVFLGTDNIGSGSYYGLFDPFMFICYLLPRAWIPQTYAWMTMTKLMVGALFMRCYLKKMGIQEWTARFGAVAYAFSGFTTFFEGSPNFTSAMAFFPLILLGLEYVIQDRKITALSFGIFLLGISCFFYMPVICIFGVIYAVWRFFTTIKTRDGKTNVLVMILGVVGFAIGILLSAFSLLPSFRETTLSGRSSSIGTAYLHSILNSLKSFDFKMFFTFIFEEVGDSPGRELMGVVSFFFPTGGWTNLPFIRGGYDAWTASLFCFTPCVILFFAALMNSIRLKKWGHLLAVFICVYAVLTNFSYFFFYAFSGNGYGRWYLVLTPLIIYYACWAFDLRKEEPRFIPFAASIIALIGTIATYYLCEALLKDQSFTSSLYNTHNTTYWQTTYHTASEVYNGVQSAWYFYYQVALVVIEGSLLCFAHRHEWLKYILFGLVCVEAVVMGNVTYAYNGTWSLKNSFASGASNVSTSLVMTNAIRENDNSFYRTQMDNYFGSNYAHNVFGTSNVASFHSLMNFDVETFALNNQMKHPGTTRKTYGDEEYYNPNWSGDYANKRYVADTLLGMRYYQVTNNYSSFLDADGNPSFLPPNVPFGCVEKESYSPDRLRYRVYRREESSLPNLGYAVDSNILYRMGNDPDSHFLNNFFHGKYGAGAFYELEWTQYVEFNGAILDDDAVLPETFKVKATVPTITTDSDLEATTGMRRLSVGANNGLTCDYYVTENDDKLFAASKKEYASEGLGYFLNHYETVQYGRNGSLRVEKDTGKVLFRPQTGTFFNDDYDGSYIEFRFYNNKDDGAPRIYALGDRMREDGTIEENVCLGFDHHLLNSASKDYYVSQACTFGLYARGRVRSIVLCFGGMGSADINVSNFYCVVTPYSKIMQNEEKIRKNALIDVKTDVNTFTFKTAYDQDRIVLTQLGYDKGWNATANVPGKGKVACTMLRLNGGLVGFIAPSALDENGNPLEVTYELRYDTPFMKLGIAAFVAGVVLFFTVAATQFYVTVKAKKKEQEAAEA